MTEPDMIAEKTEGLISDIINRIHDDADFKDALLNNPEQALASSGFADQIDQLVDDAESEAEVSGFAFEVSPLTRIGRIDLKNTTILASAAGKSMRCSGSYCTCDGIAKG